MTASLQSSSISIIPIDTDNPPPNPEKRTGPRTFFHAIVTGTEADDRFPS